MTGLPTWVEILLAAWLALLTIGLIASYIVQAGAKRQIRELKTRLNATREDTADKFERLMFDVSALRTRANALAMPRENFSAYDNTESGSRYLRPASTSVGDQRRAPVAGSEGQTVQHDTPPAGVDQPFVEVSDPGVDYSEEAAKELFQRWCRTGVRPGELHGWEIRTAEHARAPGAIVPGQPAVKLIRDSKRSGDFVRMSAAGSDTAIVYPNPDANFSTAVGFLFNTLDVQSSGNGSLLAGVTPVRVHRRSDDTWEVV